jgi:peptide/nickel transport system substrate-binding protein
MASTVDPPGLNPLVANNAVVSYFAPLVHGYLLDTDGEGRLLPSLATAVPTAANGGIASDGRTVTYHLRRGVRWHDGAPFDARDVVFSFRAAMNPNNAVPDRTGFDHVADVRALDPYTVRVRLTRAFSPFVASCFTMGANDPYPVLPAHLLAGKHDLNRDPYNGAPIGLGPYRFVSWQRGSRIAVEADPHYWRGAPAIRRIEIAIVPNVNTQQTLWQSGQLDFVIARASAGRVFLDALRATPHTRVELKPHYQFEYLVFNRAHPPLDDERVRRAIAQTIDRSRIMHDLRGELDMPGESDRLPGQFAYDPSIVQPRYDPIAAGKTLDAAGWRLVNGVRTKNGRALAIDLVSTTESPTTGRFDLLAQQDLAKIGIRANEKSYSYNLIWAAAAQHGINQTGRFDVEYSGWQPNVVADHSYLFRCDTRPPNGDNLGGICDPAIEAGARTELDTTDPRREAAGDRAITRAIVARTYLLFLGFVREGVVYREGLEGVVPAVTGMHLWNVYAWRLRR